MRRLPAALATALLGALTAASLLGTPPADGVRAEQPAAKPLRDVMFVGNNWAGTATVVGARSLRVLKTGIDLTHGGAIAIGHPLGASAPRVIVDACRELRRRGGGYAVAAACIGVGQGTAMVVHVD